MQENYPASGIIRSELNPIIMKKLIPFFLVVLLNNANAQFVFQKSIGTTYQDGTTGVNEAAIVQTDDGGYCAGGTTVGNNGDIYLVKLNAGGDTIWTRTFGGSNTDVLYAMSQTSDKGFILCGVTSSFGLTDREAYLIKTDELGNLVWSKTYGGPGDDYFTSVIQTDDNGFAACGRASNNFCIVKIDAAGEINWGKVISAGTWASSIRQTFDKGFIIAGNYSGMDYHICLVKTDSLGNTAWSKVSTASLGEAAYCVRQCSDSSYIVTGYTNNFGAGAQDAFLLKVDQGGDLKWMRTYGGIWEDIGYSVEENRDKGFIITGRTQSFGPFASMARNVYLLRTNPAGEILWTRVYGSIINNGYTVTPTLDSGYIIVSNPGYLQIIKTDSSAHIYGCNEQGTNTIINTVFPLLVSQPSVSGSWGTAANAGTVTGHTFISMNNSSICPANPLSVQLISFSAVIENCNSIRLNWQTVQELNNKGFEIERSDNGYQFKKIAFVAGKGNSSNKQTYLFTVSMLHDQALYFRLKQIDLDGSFSYSSVVVCKNICNDKLLTVSPNPVRTSFQIAGLRPNKNNVTVFDMSGVKVAEWINTSQNNFDVGHLSKGVYFIKINDEKIYKILKE